VEMGTQTTVPVLLIALLKCITVFANKNETRILMDLYARTNGPLWEASTRWGSNSTVCDWHGISCAGGSVTGIVLTFNGLDGSLPATLSQLTHLRTLDLHGNPMLGGELPESLGDLNKLEMMDLSFCRVTGCIPPSFGKLASLLDLKLNNNELEYAIPDEITSLVSLQTLWLHANRLTHVPSIYLLVNLESLRLSNNEFAEDLPVLGGIYTGPYTPYIGGLTKCKEIHLGYNRFTGVLGFELGQLQSLEVLHLQSNKLMGFVPPEIGLLPALASLRIDNNRLSGKVDKDVVRPAISLLCNMTGNAFTCPIPSEVVLKYCLTENECSGPNPGAI